MFQSLILIASIVVLSGAILTSTLVSARNAVHQVIVAKTQTAMTDATSEFTVWAQQYVAAHGTEANWTTPNPPPAPIFRPLCAPSTVNCAFYETISWTVTGATVSTKPATGGVVSNVQNMAPAVDEQRISATVSVTISDATGRDIKGGKTEELTARVFDATPYVVVTGVHDLSADSGIVTASEGDSGGADNGVYYNAAFSKPNPLAPADYVNTEIHTTIDCVNSGVGFDENNPKSAADAANGNIISKRTGGNQQWAYQLPCIPGYPIAAAPSSATNYTAPVGATYAVGLPTGNTAWEKGDQDTSSFPR